MLAAQEVFGFLNEHVAAYVGYGVGERNVLGADFNAVLREAALLYATVAGQCTQAIFFEDLAGGVVIEELDLGDGVERACGRSSLFIGGVPGLVGKVWLDGFSKPCNGLPEIGHVVQPFLVVLNLPLVQPKPKIPIGGPRYDHPGHEEHVIDRVEDVRASTPSRRNHAGADLAAKGPVVCQSDQAGPVEQRLHLRAYVGEVGGRAQDDGIGLDQFLHAVVEDVVFRGTLPVFVFETLETGKASPDVLASDLDELGFPSGGLEGFQYLLKHRFGVTALSGTSIYGYGLHVLFLLQISVNFLT